MKLIQRFKQSSIANQASMVLAAIVTIATVVNVCVFISQYKFSQKTSNDNSTQTQQLINAANKNADAATQFAISADGMVVQIRSAVTKLNSQALATKSLADAALAQSEQSRLQTSELNASFQEAEKQAEATNLLAKAAARSANAADTANQQTGTLFEKQNRAWVGLDGEFDSAPMTDANNMSQFVYQLRNSGGSPATNVVVPWKELKNSTSLYNEIEIAMNELCKNGEHINSMYETGDIILPNSTQTKTVGVAQEKESMVFMVGCIVYRDTTKKIHHTRVCRFTDQKMHYTPKYLSCYHESAD